jgi:hypothetical protein
MGRFAAIVILGATVACTSSPSDPVDGGPDGAADADDGGDASDADPGDADSASDCGYGDGPRGVHVSQVFHPVVLWTCDGEPASVPDICCVNDVTIVHLSTLWCVVCETATSMLQRDVMAPLAGEPVALVELLLEEDHGEVATTEGCRLWSERFEPDVPTYIPPDGDISEELAEIAAVGAPPVTFVLDSEGEIRWRSNTAIPDMLDEEMAQLLEQARRIIDENERH